MLWYNSNGKQYWKLYGEIGKPGLLIRLDTQSFPYIVAGQMEKYEWHSGYYFNDFEEAYEAYKRLLKER